jgi:hypothetical protein
MLFFLRAYKHTSMMSLGSTSVYLGSDCFVGCLLTVFDVFLIAGSLAASTLPINAISSLPLFISLYDFGT